MTPELIATQIKTGKTVKEIASMYNLSQTTVYRKLKQTTTLLPKYPHRRRHRHNDAAVMDMRRRGFTFQEIGKRLGINDDQAFRVASYVLKERRLQERLNEVSANESDG